MTAKLIAALSLLLAFAGLGLWGQEQHLSAVKAKAQVKTLTNERDLAMSDLREVQADASRKAAANLALRQQTDRLAAEAAKTTKALNEALKANRDWADAPVPDGVWDALAPAPGGQAKARPRVDGGSGGAPAGRP